MPFRSSSWHAPFLAWGARQSMKKSPVPVYAGSTRRVYSTKGEGPTIGTQFASVPAAAFGPKQMLGGRHSALYGFSAGNADEDDVAWACRESHVLRAPAMAAAKPRPSHCVPGSFTAKRSR